MIRVCLSLLLVGPSILSGAPPANPDFEEGEVGQVPTGWFAPLGARAGYRVELVEDSPRSGKRCVRIVSEDQTTAPFGNVMQSFAAAEYRGQRVRFRAAVKFEGAAADGRAQLWLRVDRPDEQRGFFDNMGDRPITDATWRDYEIMGDVAKDAETINLGCMLIGRGRTWLDAVSFEAIGEVGAGQEPPHPLEGRALENLVAFTRLLGYVRHFHPSDEAAAADWDAFAIAGVRAVESAAGPAELATILQELFAPVAPTIRVFESTEHPAIPDALSPPDGAIDLQITMWKHSGFGGTSPSPIYRSRRARWTNHDGKLPGDWRRPSEPLLAELCGGVSCLVPLALLADDRGTLPHPNTTSRLIASPLPAGFTPSGNDRTTRLAAVALCWNVLQHFYPYFDVVATDWRGALREALSRAATDADERAFLATLRRLIAHLHDGHGFVGHGSDDAQFAPAFLWDWIEGRLIVTHVDAAGAGDLRPGDIVRTVNGRPAAQALAEAGELVSAATDQFRRWRALDALLAGPRRSGLTLEIEPCHAGETPTEPSAITMLRTAVRGSIKEPRTAKVGEIKPGIWYLDLDRIDDNDFRKALPELEKARGLVFDLRGYPSRLSTVVLAHLIDAPVTCAQWHVPQVSRPDHVDMQFAFSNWTVAPEKPRLDARTAFITDGRAISYAETYLGIVEHYNLAEIVGGPTAGTNGNVNTIKLPGSYTVAFTGMKVLKHDGAQHHGVGIRPTVPVTRTIKGVAEGRDELLEKAAEVV
ncbi:MAG TPA: S41 family peptidase, partial [Phycisphaerae bacterium]